MGCLEDDGRFKRFHIRTSLAPLPFYLLSFDWIRKIGQLDQDRLSFEGEA